MKYGQKDVYTWMPIAGHHCELQPTSYVACLKHHLPVSCSFSQGGPGKNSAQWHDLALLELCRHGLLHPVRLSLSLPEKNNHIWENKSNYSALLNIPNKCLIKDVKFPAFHLCKCHSIYNLITSIFHLEN